MEKTSISVRDMGRMLGLGKTESYWLVKKQYFEVKMVAKHMRVMIDSFETWYANQVHYSKINGELPGSALEKSIIPISEVGRILNISEATVYDHIKHEYYQSVHIGYRTRVDRTSFEAWYATQTRYSRKQPQEEEADV